MRKRLLTVAAVSAGLILTPPRVAPAAPCKGSLSRVTATSGSASPTCHTPFGSLERQRCAPKLG